jgi:hypothetical protein
MMCRLSSQLSFQISKMAIRTDVACIQHAFVFHCAYHLRYVFPIRCVAGMSHFHIEPLNERRSFLRTLRRTRAARANPSKNNCVLSRASYITYGVAKQLRLLSVRRFPQTWVTFSPRRFFVLSQQDKVPPVPHWLENGIPTRHSVIIGRTSLPKKTKIHEVPSCMDHYNKDANRPAVGAWKPFSALGSNKPLDLSCRSNHASYTCSK